MYSLQSLHRDLMSGANPSGGWPYYAGKASRIEPTCWALLALSALKPSDTADSAALHYRFLTGCQRPDGLLVENPRLPVNLAFNGLAALTLLARDHATDSVAVRLCSALVRTKGVQVPSTGVNDRQDNALQGWPWIDGTFSWVEPTAWCLLALKRQRRLAGSMPPEVESRIREAEQLLINRTCRQGGWNYGNARTLGQELKPYSSTTAIGLMAMYDHHKLSVIARGVEYLREHRHDERSGMALALSSICLHLYGLPTADLGERLLAQAARTKFLSNYHITALALCSLAGGTGEAAFRI